MNHSSVQSDVALGPMTTYKVGGNARWYAEPKDLEDLRSILEIVPEGTHIFVLGRGSNVVISDAGVDGLVLRLAGAFSAVEITEDHVVAGAALALPKLARLTAEAGRAGLEFYVGIPGSVGGAVRMNAGGHGTETSDVLLSAVVVDLQTGSLSKRDGSTFDFAYRHSNLDDNEVVVQATLSVSIDDSERVTRRLREITRWRKENQPGGTLNAGSVFKNPADQSAGSLIDACGLKGFTLGGVTVSEKHANFMVVSPGAAANDIYALVSEVQDKVLDIAGVKLDPEIRFIGDFPPIGDRT